MYSSDFHLVKFFKRYGGIILFLIALVVYANTLSHGFVYDDTFFINRRELRQIQYLPKLLVESYLPNNRTAGAYRPLTVISFSLNYILFGDSPVSFHVVNVLLHAATTWLLYKLLKLFKFSFSIAFIAGLIFAVHPIHVEAVANIKARDELFHAFFLLLAVLFTVSKNKWKNTIFYCLINSLIFFAALMAKEMAVTIPVIILIVMVIKKMSVQRMIIQLLFFVVMLSIYAGLRYYALGGSLIGSFYSTDFVGNKLYVASVISRLFTGFEIYGIYLKTLLFPMHLSATYGYAQLVPIDEPLQVFRWIPGFMAFTGTLMVCCIALVKRRWLFGAFVLMWLVVYLPVSQMIIPMGDIVAERWLYAPSLIVIPLILVMLFRLTKLKKFLITVIIVITVTFSIRTVMRNTVWASNFSLYSNMTQTAPLSVQAHTGLGYEYFKLKEFELAKKHAIIAEKIYPDFPNLKNLLGNIATLERRYDDAESYYKQSLELSSTNIQTYTFLAGMYFSKGDFQKAYEIYTLTLNKKNTFIYEDIISYAATLSKLKRYDESLQMLEMLSANEREREQTQFLLAVNFYKKGDKEKVLEHIRWNKALSRAEREKILETY